MDAAQGLQSVAYVGPNRQQPILTLDLEGEFPLSRIHLHDVDQDDTVPQSFTSKLGIPRHLRIEGANQADFSDAKTLLETRLEMVNGPIMMWRIPETTCRYVRLYDATKSPDFRIGFAEIELFSNGRNVARGQTVHTGLPPRFVNPSRPLTALTDGRNLFGNILPIRDWLRQLARRHDLEIERLAVMTELNHRYARQKTNLNRMIWLAALLAAGIGFTILIDRNIRMKQQTRIKERFAADLHDEVGANIHTISMLSDLAQAAESPDESTSIHQRILKLTDRTDTAIRYCSNMLEADGLYFGLIEDMKRVAQRISGNFEHKVSFEGEPWIKQLPPRTRIDLFLFYKECLVNISRHSDATQVTTQLTATAKNLHLLIKDNGQGMTADPLPSSLKRRARMLGARMTVDSPPEGGACVTLSLKLRKRFRLSLRNKEHDENSH
jgi:signal transduction histidine kinase